MGEHINCVECGRPFVWSYEEQRYYRERGLSDPRHCKLCRAKHRDNSGMRNLVGPPLEVTTSKEFSSAEKRLLKEVEYFQYSASNELTIDNLFTSNDDRKHTTKKSKQLPYFTFWGIFLIFLAVFLLILVFILYK